MVGGEPRFVAKDVCDVLDLSDVSMSISRLDDDEKGTSKVCTPGGTQEMSIITESGLYTLVLRSNKPEAKRFRKWVTSEVLPAIRKHGSYSVHKEIPEPDPSKKIRADAMLLNAKARLAHTMDGILSKHISRISDVSVDAFLGEVLYMATGVRALAPKVGKSYTASELAKEFGVSPQRIGLIATKYGLRNERYGFTFLDTTLNGKQVENFRYSDYGRSQVKARLMEDGYFSSDDSTSGIVNAENLQESYD
jgi:hypothetical protein